jgi:hypothetical protein
MIPVRMAHEITVALERLPAPPRVPAPIDARLLESVTLYNNMCRRANARGTAATVTVALEGAATALVAR